MKSTYVLITVMTVMIAGTVVLSMACSSDSATAYTVSQDVAGSNAGKAHGVSDDNVAVSVAATSVAGTPPAVKITEPPAISDLQYVLSGSTAAISWKTREETRSLIRYGTDLTLPFTFAADSEKSTRHSVFLTGLAPETFYHHRIYLTDDVGNACIASSDMTFTTAPVNHSANLGSVAPDFTLNSIQGKKITLSQYRGKKVILNFWETWCAACLAQLPLMQKESIVLSGRSDAVLVTVAGNVSDLESMKAFMAKNEVDFTVCLDDSAGVFNTYNITTTPRTFFLDKEGVVRKIVLSWFTSTDAIENVLNSY